MLLSVLAAAAALAAPVPPGDVLVSSTGGAMLIVQRDGRTVRKLPWKLDREPQAIELAPDRRHAYISLWQTSNDLPAQLFLVDLANGKRTLLADAISPALSPDHTRLAYVSLSRQADITRRTALVIKTLRNGQPRAIPIVPPPALGTPPELVINWAPDGRHVALFNGFQTAFVDVATGTAIPSLGPVGINPRYFAPVYIGSTAVVVETGCCVGRQQLTVIDVNYRRRFRFATLSSPVEQVRRIGKGRLLVVTALHELAVVTRGHVSIRARHIFAASP